MNNDLWLISFDVTSISTMNMYKAIREVVPSLSLKEALEIAQNTPSLIYHYDSYREVLSAKNELDSYDDSIITEIR